jgi:hypothetical protein
VVGAIISFMGRRNIIIILCFCYAPAFSQTDSLHSKLISIQFHWSAVGANISNDYAFHLRKIEPFVGLMYHINTPINNRRSFTYRHSFYNKSFVDGLGVDFGFRIPIKIPDSNLGLNFFMTNQISHMHNRALITICDTNSINYQFTRTPDYIYVFSPSQMWILENYVGFGMSVKVYRRIFINLNASIGIANYMVKNQFTNNQFFRDWEFSDNYLIGLSYLIP